MKQLLIIVTVALLTMASCQKEISNKFTEPVYLTNVKASVRDSLSAGDYESLDFTKVFKMHIDSGDITLLRIGFKQRDIDNNFILLQTNENGKCLKGRIVTMNGDVNEKHQYNGTILIEGLNRNELIRSPVTNGFINAFLSPASARLTTVQPAYVELPEVVVVGSYNNGGISWGVWMSLLSFFDNYNYAGGFGYYGMGDLYGGGGGGGGGYGSGSSGNNGAGNGNSDIAGGGPVIIDEPIYIDFENQYSDPAIDLEKYMKCFTDIPDAGATGSIEIFTDIPVNGDPSKFFDWDNGSPGHTFIQLRKQNGSQSVSQNIGFYPRTGWKTAISPAPIDGKWVDNHAHEFNASYKVNLTAAQVQTAVTRILYLSHFVRYDIDDYNCTDWALSIFNETVSVQQHLDIPRYDIPGGEAPNGTSTPNGLYNKLVEMKNAGGQAAASIVIPVFGWVGQSHGPCN